METMLSDRSGETAGALGLLVDKEQSCELLLSRNGPDGKNAVTIAKASDTPKEKRTAKETIRKLDMG